MDEPQRRSSDAELRLVAGFALGPPTAGLVTFLIFLTLFYFDLDPSPGRPVKPVDAAGSLGFSAFILAVPITVFGALPAFRWLARRGPVSLRTSLLFGAALGNVPFALGILILISHVMLNGKLPGPPADLRPPDMGPARDAGFLGIFYDVPGLTRTIGVGLGTGMISAALFWVVAVRGGELDPAGRLLRHPAHDNSC